MTCHTKFKPFQHFRLNIVKRFRNEAGYFFSSLLNSSQADSDVEKFRPDELL